jgi:hypothetical protein
MVSPVRGDYRRCQAEIPLIDLFKFAEPALYRKRDRALERVVALWEKDQDVNDALDVLTLAHTAATFKFVGG